MLGACLGHASLEVALAALSAVANLIQALEEQAERDRFTSMINPMLSCLGRALQAGDEASAQEALEVLIEVRGPVPEGALLVGWQLVARRGRCAESWMIKARWSFSQAGRKCVACVC